MSTNTKHEEAITRVCSFDCLDRAYIERAARQLGSLRFMSPAEVMSTSSIWGEIVRHLQIDQALRLAQDV
ncbi:hypothetical protein [Cupriavidus oxalaticus]|uniref:Uncharacterized protein n=1 Tax=Cupriavidus oxalaticus TaxID=96344 RepID=A0A4P7LKM5_9BURK|nr:hypothetical protein [Cupriavidus oxalaticus]QBY56118.1 hypothetical protein E0W60_34225 [Cupriavidus oxalaticus]